MKTTIHTFNFDISYPDQKAEWEKLFASLKAMGLKPMDAYGNESEEIKAMNGRQITLETEYLFDNQWNTKPFNGSKNGWRVFDFRLYTYPNKRLKVGHWLEQTDAMKAIRNDNFKCGYCGAMHYRPDEFAKDTLSSKYCMKCIGSEHLKQSELFLLELIPVSKERNYKNTEVPNALIQLYNDRQRVTRTARLEKLKKDKLEDLQNEIKEKEIEHDGMKILINHDLDFDNVIYYNHSKTFSFGWREKIVEEIGLSIRDKLIEISFPYPFEIQCIGGRTIKDTRETP